MQIEQKWQDSISKETPKLCHVWDDNSDKARNVYKVIDCYKIELDLPYRVIGITDIGYRNAMPISPDYKLLYRKCD